MFDSSDSSEIIDDQRQDYINRLARLIHHGTYVSDTTQVHDSIDKHHDNIDKHHDNIDTSHDIFLSPRIPNRVLSGHSSFSDADMIHLALPKLNDILKMLSCSDSQTLNSIALRKDILSETTVAYSIDYSEIEVIEDEMMKTLRDLFLPINLKRTFITIDHLYHCILPSFHSSMKMNRFQLEFTTIGHIFCAIDSISLVEFLLTEMEFPIDLADSSDSTMLMQCVYYGQKDIVALLLFYGADPFLQDDMGRNIMQIAAMTRRIDMIYFLLPRIVGLDSLLTHIDSFGKSVFDYLPEQRNAELLFKYSL